jgi:RNA polymerase sigma-70 factor (ECF subfamily)
MRLSMNVASDSHRSASDGRQDGNVLFAQWVAPHWPSMVALAMRMVAPPDVEDVVQDALLAAWRLRDRFDETRGTARSWLLTLTVDHARRAGRKRARSPRFTAVLDDAAVCGVDTTIDQDLTAAIIKLSPRQRLAVSLYYYLDLPIADVAATMKCSPGTAKSTLSDARLQLRRLLGDNYEH